MKRASRYGTSYSRREFSLFYLFLGDRGRTLRFRDHLHRSRSGFRTFAVHRWESRHESWFGIWLSIPSFFLVDIFLVVVLLSSVSPSLYYFAWIPKSF